MVLYEDEVKKAVAKGSLPKEVFMRINNVFVALDKTHDLSLFDIKRLKSTGERSYYRIRKGKYRAIFFIEDDDYYVISITKREEAYDRWE